jgi:amino acid adenylation domain-containing protein
MDKIKQLTDELADNGIEIYLRDGKLKARSEKGKITPHYTNLISEYKIQLITYLQEESVSQRQKDKYPKLQPSESTESDNNVASFSQQRLWFVEQVEKDSAQYNMPVFLDIYGRFEIRAAEQALSHVIKRHSPLRTRFEEVAGELIQVICPPFDFNITRIDLADLSESVQVAELKKLINKESMTPFDINSGCLVRASFIYLGERTGIPYGVLAFNVHHIASDGWSMGILTEEFVTAYQALVQGKAVELTHLPVSYCDFARWQRDWMTPEVINQQLDYWENLLQGAPSCHSLPLDRIRSKQPKAGMRVDSSIEPALTEKIYHLCARTDSTLFMLLQTAFAVHIGRLSHQTDVVMGSPDAGRPMKEFEPLIGFFINTQIYRVQFDDNPSFIDLLTRTKNQHIQSSSFKNVPFESLVERLNPSRDVLHSPVFQILINLNKNHTPEIKLDDLLFRSRQNFELENKYDITLYISEDEKTRKIDFYWVFDSRIFDTETIETFASEFNHLLIQLVSYSDLPVLIHGWAAHPLDDAMQQLETGLPVDSVMGLFAHQVTQTPEAIALVCDDQILSYQALDYAASRLANYLQAQLGSTGTKRIAIGTGRNSHRVISILAVLKLGACYVPLSQEFPEKRIDAVLNITAPDLILLDNEFSLSNEVTAHYFSHIIQLNSPQLQQALQNHSVQFEAKVPKYEDPCHIIFTSGSTGEPKGVIGTYGSTYHRLAWMLLDMPYGDNEAVAHITSMAFIRAVWELLLPLCGGARLHLISRSLVKQTDALWLELRSKKITRLVTAPSLLEAICEAKAIDNDKNHQTTECGFFNTWYVSGEPLTMSLVRKFKACFPQVALYNLYGSTEVMSDVTYWLCNEDYPKLLAPIGRSAKGCRVTVVDRLGNPVSAGVIGELLVSGSSIAAGYLNYEQGKNGPFIDSSYGRSYLTGDLGRMNRNGELECLGRKDDQIKIRGYRIEPAEIRSHIRAQLGVKDAVVMALPVVTNEPELCVWLLPVKSGDSELLTAVRASLSSILPDFMVPVHWLLIDHLPTKPNGKIDKKALPLPVNTNTNLKERAELSPYELQLAEIWSELLKKPTSNFDRETHFFDAGGHSLLAVRLVSMLKKKHSLTLPIQVIFESPTLASMASRIEKLVQAGQSSVLADKNFFPQESRAKPSFKLEKRKNQLSAPMSSSQRRLWFIDQMEGGSPQYNMPLALEINGKFDPDIAELAIKGIIRRHEILRTQYMLMGNEPQQVIYHDFDFTLKRIDLRGLELSKQERVIELQKIVAETQFDLKKDLALRAMYVALSEENDSKLQPESVPRGILFFNVHHIASDGWSSTILANEFVAHYQALLHDKPVNLPELNIQYADYAQWQQDWLASGNVDEQLNYWQQQLKDAPMLHQLPLDFVRPAIQKHVGDVLALTIEPVLSAAVRKLSKQHGCTVFMVIHAALSLLFSRHSNNGDILIGTAVANRMHEELVHLIGFFVNTLVLRTEVKPQNLTQFLAHVRQVNLDAQLHQDTPFDYLVEHCQVPRSLQHSPFFQLFFTMNTTEASDATIDGLNFVAMDYSETAVKFDLEIQAMDTGQCIQFAWKYDTAIFRRETIERFSQHLVNLLSAMVLADTTQNVTEFSMLNAHELQSVIQQSQGRRRVYPVDVCVQTLFAQQVKKTPNQIALVFEEKSLTYEELDKRANCMARYLQSMGVELNTCVALCMDRSVEMVVAIWAILKAGGAYLPLPPDLPAQRRYFVIEDSTACLLLTQSHLLGSFSEAETAKAVIVAIDTEAFLQHLTGFSELPFIADMDQLSDSRAYVIYTSGSTGNPKGVECSHRGLVNRIFWMQDEYQITLKDKVLQKTPYSFDVSVWEFVWPMLFGAQLVVARPDGHKDPVYLFEVIRQHQITLLHFVPSMLSEMLRRVDWALCSSVRDVFCSGEVLPISLQDEFFVSGTTSRLNNLYGPTEASIDVSYWQCAPYGPMPVVPIGRPIANTDLYVLDQYLNLVSDGVVGELYIAGGALANGYLNRQQLTDEKFICQLPDVIPASRLYKTGDLVKRLSDGNLIYLGRIDRQVKVRGFRIELGEIESALRTCENVQDVAVMINGSDDSLRLVAYIVLSTDMTIDTASLSQNLMLSLKDTLPDYMLPNQFCYLEKLPLTVSGKINHKALPAPEQLALTVAYHAPSNDTERALTVIWSQLLKLASEQISVEASFFDLGGHSLLAVRLSGAIRAEFGRELALKTIFELSNIRQLAAYIDTHTEKVVREKIIASPRETELYPLSFSQQRLWFIDNMQKGSPEYNMPSALKVDGPLDIAAAEQALRAIIARHESLRTVFQVIDDGPVQKVMAEFSFNLQQHDFTGLQEKQQIAKVTEFIQSDSEDLFDLSADLMIRASYLTLSRDDKKPSGVLVFNMHHIASDGWSLRLLEREFIQHYKLLTQQYGTAPESLAIQYIDYSLWQRRLLHKDELDKQLDYWQDLLQGAPQTHGLQLDRPRSDAPRKGGAVYTTFEPRQTRMVQKLLKETQSTLFMFMQTALAVHIGRLSNETDVVMGAPIAGRVAKETEQLIGFFLNTQLFRTVFDDNPEFTVLLARSRNQHLESSQFNEVPFEAIVERLKVERHVSRPPLFQILLNLNNNERTSERIDNVSFTSMETRNSENKYDITLYINEGEEQGQHVLYLSWVYDQRIFDPQTIELFANEFIHLLEQICVEPKQNVLSYSWQQGVTQGINLCDAPITLANTSVAYLFEAQALRSQNATALSIGDQHWSYQQLNDLVNQLAGYLSTKQKLSSSSRIGIATARNIHRIVAHLASYKLGACYIPLSQELPEMRIQQMLEDAQADVVLADTDFLAGKNGITQYKCLNLDDQMLQAEIAAQPTIFKTCTQVSDDQVASIIFTSGSTGRPKGVLSTHIATANRVRWMLQQIPFEADESVAHITSMAFIRAIWELLVPLCGGARLVLVDREIVRQTDVLFILLREQKITRLVTAPSLMKALTDCAEIDGGSKLPNIGNWFVSGEPLLLEDAYRFKSVFTDTRLFNLYGSTEVMSDVTWHEVGPDDGQGYAPIGQAIPGVNVIVVDAVGQPVPAGVVGELMVSGVAVAAGYLPTKETTSSGFFTVDGVRYFKTGDLGRFKAGRLECFGRKDDQIKLNGQRIELGEICYQLMRCDGVKKAAVLCNKQNEGQIQIIAYIIPEQSDIQFEEVLLGRIRHQLSAVLPQYMIPTKWICLSTFPLKPNGKLDRKLLILHSNNTQVVNQTDFVTKTQHELRAIWAQLLNRELDEICVNTSFFEIGGHSLLVIRLIGAIQRQLSFQLDVRQVFKNPTIMQISELIDRKKALLELDTTLAENDSLEVEEIIL